MNTSIVQKFRKKPAVIEAIKFTEHNAIDVSDFVTEVESHYITFVYDYATLKTPNGETHVSRGDYVIKKSNGMFGVVKSGTFGSEYELIPESTRKAVCSFHCCKKEVVREGMYCEKHKRGTCPPLIHKPELPY